MGLFQNIWEALDESKEAAKAPPPPGVKYYSRPENHLELLGLPVEDSVTGFEGVVASINYDLYGCIQAAVTPKAEESATKVENSHWFDVTRLKPTSLRPVMEAPDFNKGYSMDEEVQEERQQIIAEGRKGGFAKPMLANL